MRILLIKKSFNGKYKVKIRALFHFLYKWLTITPIINWGQLISAISTLENLCHLICQHGQPDALLINPSPSMPKVKTLRRWYIRWKGCTLFLLSLYLSRFTTHSYKNKWKAAHRSLDILETSSKVEANMSSSNVRIWTGDNIQWCVDP